jgi:hypothetical protein
MAVGLAHLVIRADNHCGDLPQHRDTPCMATRKVLLLDVRHDHRDDFLVRTTILVHNSQGGLAGDHEQNEI